MAIFTLGTFMIEAPGKSPTVRVIDLGTSMFKATGDHGKDLDRLDADRFWAVADLVLPGASEGQRLAVDGTEGLLGPQAVLAALNWLSLVDAREWLSSVLRSPGGRNEADTDPLSSNVYRIGRSFGAGLIDSPGVDLGRVVLAIGDIHEAAAMGAVDGVRLGIRTRSETKFSYDDWWSTDRPLSPQSSRANYLAKFLSTPTVSEARRAYEQVRLNELAKYRMRKVSDQSV